MSIIVEKIVMFSLSKLIEWATDPENIKKMKNYLKGILKEKADKEGKDVWDYLYDLFKDV